jgi:hypothetical protein
MTTHFSLSFHRALCLQTRAQHSQIIPVKSRLFIYSGAFARPWPAIDVRRRRASLIRSS